jgi:cytochrome P450
MQLAPRPDHVPPELVIDFDFLEGEKGDDLYQWWGALHDGPDVFWSPRYGGHWVLTRYEDIEHALENFREFSSRYQTLPKEGRPIPFPPIETDPPRHNDFKRLIAPFFSPKSISELESRARTMTIELIEGFRASGGCEFSSEFALHMPIGIFMWLADLPMTDRLPVLAMAEKMVRGHDAEHLEGAQEAFAYLGRIIEERRANPGRDMISAVVTGTVEGGRPLTLEEEIGMVTLLMVGGLDTVAGMMGFIMQFLAGSPAHRRQLAEDPARIKPAIEELMRRHHIANVSRLVVEDTAMRGVEMKAGDMVLTATTLAGLDPKRFDDPFTVDFDRADKRHLVFGKGVHTCIGAFLARTELNVFLSEWMKRIPDFEIASGEKPICLSGRANAVSYLPLRWET